MIGGAGADQLVGGLGADLFMFESFTEMGVDSTRDRIKDFSASQGDRIDLATLNLQWTDSVPMVDGTDYTNTIWFERGALKISSDADGSAEYEIALTGLATLDESFLLL